MANINPNTKTSESQSKQLYAAMMQGEVINPYKAWVKFSCYRLASRICDIRKEGKQISTRWMTSATGKKVKEYYMTEEDIKANS